MKQGEMKAGIGYLILSGLAVAVGLALAAGGQEWGAVFTAFGGLVFVMVSAAIAIDLIRGDRDSAQ